MQPPFALEPRASRQAQYSAPVPHGQRHGPGRRPGPAVGLAPRDGSLSPQAVTHFRGEHGVRFMGDRGWVQVIPGGLRTQPEEPREVQFRPADQRLPVSADHVVDFRGDAAASRLLTRAFRTP